MDNEVIDVTDTAAIAAADTAVPSDVVTIGADDEEAEKLPRSAQLQDDGSVILILMYPVALKWKRGTGPVREESYTSLHMHRLNGAAMRAVMSAGKGHVVSVGIAKSARMEQGVFNVLFDRMDAADTAAAGQVFNYFLYGGATAPTGQPSSP